MKASKEEILQIEERLRLAMLNSDVDELDLLLADDLVFVAHTGVVLRKEDDLNAHKTQVVQIFSIELSDWIIRTEVGFAIVTVLAEIDGAFNNQRLKTTLRFSRVWGFSEDNKWQVLSGQSTLVV